METIEILNPDPRQSDQPNRQAKASLFEDLFSQQDNLHKLADELHLPSTEESKVRSMTIQRILSTGRYNDLAFLLDNSAIVLVEASSTSPNNLPYRMTNYASDVVIAYTAETKQNEYSTRKICLPPLHLFALCPFEKGDDKDLHLYSPEQKSDLNVCVHVITHAPKNTLIGQYFAFCHLMNQVAAEFGEWNAAAMSALLKTCKEQGILVDYLETKKGEIEMILTEEYTEYKKRLAYIDQGREEGQEQGREQGREEAREETAFEMLKRGLDHNLISSVTKVSEQRLKELANSLSNHAPSAA